MQRVHGLGRTVGAVLTSVALVLGLVVVGAGNASAAAACHPYPDVNSSNSACANIAWLKAQEITKPADGRYHPTHSVTRGSMVAFLFRLTHPSAPSPKCASKPFPDVPTSNVFCGYISWAKNNGVAFGYADGSFGPNKAVTRGAMAAYLHRVGTDVKTPKCASKPFKDVATSDTFCGVITWAKKAGITYGVGGGKYGTALPVTRQAMASFLHRVHSLMNSLAGKYFSGVATLSVYDSTDNYFGVVFLDSTWAYWGRPEHGLPTCTKATTTITKDTYPDDDWGCTKYSYNPDTGALKIGGLSGKYRNGKLTVDGYGYSPTYIPPAGARYNLDLINMGFTGYCGLYGGCSTWTYGIAMNKQGEFVTSESSIITVGGSWGSNYPPDEYGTYRILPGARVKLSYANGKTKTLTFAVYYNQHGKPAPADPGGVGDGGIILGTDDYWLPDGD